jgi:hypothetical protein
LPLGVERATGSADRFLFGASLTTATTDSRGVEITEEDRSRIDGWEIDAFFASPMV